MKFPFMDITLCFEEGKIGVANYGKLLELTLCTQDRRMTNWHSVALTPKQAITLCNNLKHPPGMEFVEYASAEGGEHRYPYLVQRVKHGNGVHSANVVVHKQKGLIIQNGNNLASPGKQEYVYVQASIKLTGREIDKLSGYLYFWVGASLIGTTKVTKTKTKEVLRGIE